MRNPFRRHRDTPAPDEGQTLAVVAAAIPDAKLERAEGRYVISEPVPLWMQAAAYGYGGEYGGNSSIHSQVDKAKDPTDSIGDYYTYHWFLRCIGQFRLKSQDFETRYFEQPTQLACTDAKAVVIRPARVADENEFEMVQRRILPPFDHFNRMVNWHLVGKRGGAAELSTWILQHCLEGGVAAWSAAVQTVEINGIKWRTITEVNTYGGSQLGLDLKNTQFANERWYIRDMPQMQRTQWDNGYPIGYDSTRYEDEMGKVIPQWQKVEHSPNDGIYRGVTKYLHAEGHRSKYPVPPYAPLIDILTCRWMYTKDNLRTLHRRDKLIMRWVFDTDKMKAAGVRWADETINNPDGSTTVKPGVITQFSQQRASVVRGDMNMQELFHAGYITLEIDEPGLQLIESTDSWTQFNQEILRNSGIFIDDRGRYAKEVSEQFILNRYYYHRQHVIRPFLAQLYGIILEENKRWWFQRNGVDPDDMEHNPFVFASQRGKRILKAQPNPTVGGCYRQRLAQLDARLRGDLEDVQVKPILIPSQAVRADDKAVMANIFAKGNMSPDSFFESINLDPDEERARLLLSKNRDVYTPQPGTVSIYSPQLLDQRSVKIEEPADAAEPMPSSSQEDDGEDEVQPVKPKVKRTLSAPSPGRPVGS